MTQNIHKVSIHKKNEFLKATIKDENINTIRCLNAIMYLCQKDLPNVIKNNNEITVELKVLKRLMNLEKTAEYANIIDESLLKLQTPMTRYNYKDAEGVLWEKVNINFIAKSGIKKGYRNQYTIKLSNELINSLQIKSDFTPLEFIITQKFRSKNTMKFYELLSAYKTLPQVQKPSFSLDDLNLIFDKNYKYMSKHIELIERCSVALENTDINYHNHVYDDFDRTLKFVYTFEDNKEQEIAIKAETKKRKEKKSSDEIINKIYEELNIQNE